MTRLFIEAPELHISVAKFVNHEASSIVRNASFSGWYANDRSICTTDRKNGDGVDQTDRKSP